MATTAFEKLPWKRKLNKNQPLLNIYIQRLKNLFLKTPFNYAAPLELTEARIAANIKNSKSSKLPAFTHNWFEDDFNQTVSHAFAGQFSASNLHLEHLTGLQLSQYGYDVATSQSNRV